MRDLLEKLYNYLGIYQRFDIDYNEFLPEEAIKTCPCQKRIDELEREIKRLKESNKTLLPIVKEETEKRLREEQKTTKEIIANELTLFLEEHLETYIVDVVKEEMKGTPESVYGDKATHLGNMSLRLIGVNHAMINLHQRIVKKKRNKAKLVNQYTQLQAKKTKQSTKDKLLLELKIAQDDLDKYKNIFKALSNEKDTLQALINKVINDK